MCVVCPVVYYNPVVCFKICCRKIVVRYFSFIVTDIVVPEGVYQQVIDLRSVHLIYNYDG
jgi:hypothetical protein